jgi:hypothetical protein
VLLPGLDMKEFGSAGGKPDVRLVNPNAAPKAAR